LNFFNVINDVNVYMLSTSNCPVIPEIDVVCCIANLEWLIQKMKLNTKQNRDFGGNMFQKYGWFNILNF